MGDVVHCCSTGRRLIILNSPQLHVSVAVPRMKRMSEAGVAEAGAAEAVVAEAVVAEAVVAEACWEAKALLTAEACGAAEAAVAEACVEAKALLAAEAGLGEVGRSSSGSRFDVWTMLSVSRIWFSLIILGDKFNENSSKLTTRRASRGRRKRKDERRQRLEYTRVASMGVAQ